MIPAVLTIAGSDPSGGAGIQADLKTFHEHGVYGMSVLTLVTVQNTTRMDRVEILPAPLVAAQLDAVLEDIPPQAAKTGALGSCAIIECLAEKARNFSFPLVVDPVMISKHGKRLMNEDAQQVLAKKLLPYAYLVTPNLDEAEILCGRRISDFTSMEDAARALADFGAHAVLIKGGHRFSEARDMLLLDGEKYFFESEKIATPHTHGTGCTYSAAITARLAKGESLIQAVELAKKFMTRAILTNPGLGSGMGPVNHQVSVELREGIR